MAPTFVLTEALSESDQKYSRPVIFEPPLGLRNSTRLLSQ